MESPRGGQKRFFKTRVEMQKMNHPPKKGGANLRPSEGKKKREGAKQSYFYAEGEALKG